ncbi:MAG: septum formation initiator family protein [Oscillospiraceae bacterium]|nr:septum formation initiator family protein [Oscillospiraceae bacterium]
MLILAFLLLALLLTQREQIKAAKQQEADLAAKIEQTRQENAELEAALEKKDDAEYLQELARSELGMVAPGEKVFHDVSN